MLSTINSWLNANSQAVQAMSVALTALVTVVLVAITAWSTYLTRRTLEIMKAQYAREWHRELFAEPFPHANMLIMLEITNLGTADALVTGIQFKILRVAESPSEPYGIQEVIHAGRSKQVFIHKHVMDFFQKTLHARGDDWPAMPERVPFFYSLLFSSAGEKLESRWFLVDAVLEQNLSSGVIHLIKLV